mgnify:CR=1 FL=1
MRPATRHRLAAIFAAWPVILPFAAYALWWILGVGDFIWIIAGFIIALTWVATHGFRLPPVMLLWIMFVLWVAVSLAMTDTSGRLLGAIYRLLLYLSATALALHTYNHRNYLSIWRVSGAMVWFLAGMTVCGYLAMSFPELTIRTPMAWIMPDSLASNDLIGDMIIRRTTQWNRDAWIPQAVRPSAPFLYANTWGNVYSLVLPFAMIYLWLAWHTAKRWWVLLVIIASVFPALSTLNRGMFIGLGVVALWAGIQALRRGRLTIVFVSALGLLAGVVVWFISPSGRNFVNRIQVTNSTEDRGELYRVTFDAAMKSPLFGFGSPRPATIPGLPSMGTQGQFWTVLYSHGVIGAILFMGFLLWVLLLVINRKDPVGAALGGIIAATIVETAFYGMMTGIMVTMVAVALALRPDTIINRWDRPGISDPPASKLPRSGRKRRS